MTATNSGGKLIEPYIDLGNLLLIDRDPIDVGDLANIKSEQLNELARRNVQHLFDELWTLPRKIVQDATCAQLPECTYELPREKPIPKPKEPTKWEKFAKAKGIVKKKKSKKAWDETAKEWKPTYGYRKANDEGKPWLIEIPDQKDPYKDYFAEQSEQKREQRNKQELQRLKNVARGTPKVAENELRDSAKVAQQPQQQPQPQNKTKQFSGGKWNNRQQQQSEPLGLVPVPQKSKDQLIHQIDRAKTATASMGKFQPALKGEVKPRNTGEKRKFEPNEAKENLQAERERQLKILEGLQAKKPKLVEARVNAVGEHIRREERKFGGGSSSADFGGGAKTNRGGGRGGGRGGHRGQSRSKSQIDRQQRFQHFKKQHSGAGGSSARSKAAKARGGGRGGGGGGRGGRGWGRGGGGRGGGRR